MALLAQTASFKTDSVAPAHEAVAVTKSDSTVVLFRGIYIGGGGDLAVKCSKDSAAVTFVGVLGGTFLPLSVVRVMSTNTTATNIVGLK